MAERPQIKRSNAVIKEAQKIYHDPVLRAQWEERHAALGLYPPRVKFGESCRREIGSSTIFQR